MDEVDLTIADIASRKPILMSHPAAIEMGADIYAGTERSTVELIERATYRGRNRVTASSLLIGGGSSSFTLAPGTVIGQTYLNASVLLQVNTRCAQFWLLKLIKNIKVQLAGQSSFGDLNISGEAHFNAVMAFCASQEKRQALAEACPRVHNQIAGVTASASVPLILPWSGPEQTANYGMDTSVFNTPITVVIEWYDSWRVMSGFASTTVALPTAFTNLTLSHLETTILDPRGALGRKLRADPTLAYPIPFLNLSSSVEPVPNVVPGVPFRVTLSSLPSGMIQCIIVSLIPDDWTGSAVGSSQGTSFVHPFGVDFSSMNVTRDGQTIYQFDTRVEGDLIQSLSEDGGSGKAYWIVDSQSTVIELPFTNATYPAPAQLAVNWRHRSYVIPLINQQSEVLTGRRHEHSPNYAGVNLQIEATIPLSQFQNVADSDLSRKNQARNALDAGQDQVVTRNPGSTGEPPAAAPANYTMHVCIVRNGILETMGQTVRLIT